MNGQLKRTYRKLYTPSPMAHVINLDRYVSGDPAGIKPGTTVTVVAHYGPFRRIRDDAGNEMSVGRYSLAPVPKNLAQLQAAADEWARFAGLPAVVLVDILGTAQVVAKDSADRSIRNQPGSYFIVYEAQPEEARS